MALIKITFDNASVTSKQDADCNHFLAGGVNGIIDKVLGKCQASVSNSYIQFQSGYVQVYGRRVFVENGTKIQVSLDATAKGYVYIKFDLGNNNVTLEKKEAASSYPSLTQNDLMNGGLIYEFPLARYSKTTSSITLDSSWSPTFIEEALPIAKQALLAANGIKLKYRSVSEVFYDRETYEKKRSITLDLGNVNYSDIIIFVFHAVDEWGYSAFGTNYGSVVLPFILVNGAMNFFWISAQRNTSASVTQIQGTISEYDYGHVVTISFPSSVNELDIPSGVTAYIYSVGN